MSGGVDNGIPSRLGSMKNLQLLRDCGMEGLGNASYLSDAMRPELDKMKNLLLLKLSLDGEDREGVVKVHF